MLSTYVRFSSSLSVDVKHVVSSCVFRILIRGRHYRGLRPSLGGVHGRYLVEGYGPQKMEVRGGAPKLNSFSYFIHGRAGPQKFKGKGLRVPLC